MKYRVEFIGKQNNWFVFGCEVQASSEKEALRKGKEELLEVRRSSSYGTSHVNKLSK